MKNTNHFLILIAISVCWGINVSIVKFAVLSVNAPITVAFWQSFIGSLCALTWISTTNDEMVYEDGNLSYGLALALLHAIGANVLANFVIMHLEITTVAVIFGSTPIITFIISHIIGYDQISLKRGLGIVCGFSAMLLIFSKTILINPKLIIWGLLACCVPFIFASMNLITTKWSQCRKKYVQLTFLRYLIGSVILMLYNVSVGTNLLLVNTNLTTKLIIASIGCIEILSQALLVLLISKAGPVFSSQTSYLATIFTVIFGVILFKEIISTQLILAIVIMIIGMILVQPKKTTFKN
jgi:drug/metabolite transporter (DMT)-like permease